MITHHPEPDLLLDYASGSLSEAAALAIAAHASLCGRCAGQIARMEQFGGSLIEDVAPASVSEASLGRLLDRLDEEPAEALAVPQVDAATKRLLPKPLHAYVGGGLSRLRWRRVGRMFEEARLATRARGPKVSLMRLKPGALMPKHSHRGYEMTLVLAGGYRDNHAQFGRGDFDMKGPDNLHQPVVDDDGECLCLVVLDAPVRLTGTVGLLVNPFLRI